VSYQKKLGKHFIQKFLVLILKILTEVPEEGAEAWFAASY
jgi:hypothetical protein